MHYKTINLNVFLEAETDHDLPNPVELATGLTDGLHDDWFHTDEGYSVRFVPTLSNDAIGEFTGRIRVLTAELAQEKKLTQHLDAQVLNLIEKNDNQAAIVKGLQDQLHERTKSLDISQHEWKIKQADLNVMEANYHEAEAEGDEAVKQRDDAIARADRNYDSLLAAQAANRTNLGEAKVNEEMVVKIVDAMQGAGYDISGWGNDEQLTELEDVAIRLTDNAETLAGELDRIRTER